MKTKKILTVALIAGSLFALSGCSLSREVESLRPYAPSDGSQVDLESVKARNFLIVKGTGPQAMLIGALVSSIDGSVNFQTTDSSGGKVEFNINVKSGSKTAIGYNGTEGLRFALPADVIAGDFYSVYLDDGSGPIELLVPVVDGTLAEYRPFAEMLG